MNDNHRQAFQSALRSYNAMETTKRRHFDFLTLLETRKKKFNIDASPDDTEMLRWLLRDHDAEVRNFKECCDSLKSSDAEAHSALFEYLAQINQALAPVSQH